MARLAQRRDSGYAKNQRTTEEGGREGFSKTPKIWGLEKTYQKRADGRDPHKEKGMTPSKYTSVLDVEAYMVQAINAGFEANVERWISAVSRYMDDKANRKLVADSYDSDESFELRYFDVSTYGFVTIDDCIEIESIEYRSGDSWVSLNDTEFEVYPALAPHRRVVHGFSLGNQVVRIRARWGYMEDITEDLSWAATVLVSGICIANQAVGGNAPGTISNEKIGNYQVAYASSKDSDGRTGGLRDLDEANAIIANYRRIAL
jgi:hypothetical protein